MFDLHLLVVAVMGVDLGLGSQQTCRIEVAARDGHHCDSRVRLHLIEGDAANVCASHNRRCPHGRHRREGGA
eukprot:5894490-Prymnesium_polylepis.1